jgi:sensor histidine kinase YesM
MESLQQIFGHRKKEVFIWWKKTGHAHWQRWGVWLWVLVCAGVFWFFMSDVILDSSSRGFEDGYQAVHKDAGASTANGKIASNYRLFMNWIGLFLFIPLMILVLWVASVIFGYFHYHLIYKPIFRSYRKVNVILYLLVCMLVYEFFLADYVFEDIFPILKKEKQDDMYAYMIWAVSLLYSLIIDFRKHEKVKQALEHERNVAEIQALRAQINPHFLFNTLNNLYGTAIVEESPKTAEGIQQLARIMRHSVECSKSELIEIEQEIGFLHDYIEIQQMRISKRANINIDTLIDWDNQPAQITPLILMTFTENAFKYGISTGQESFIDIKLTIKDQELTFVCRNSIVTRTQIEKGTGMGIANTIKRLSLLYPNRHSIAINQTDTVYEVFLTMQLLQS